MHASLQCSVKQHHAAPERDGLQGRGWSVRVYSGLMLAKVRPTGTNAHTHFKSKRSEWNVTKCCLEVAAHTIGGFTVHIMFPFTAIAAHAALGNLLTELKSIVPVVAGGTTSEPRPGKSMVVR